MNHKNSVESFLLPLDRLQSATRRLPSDAVLELEPGKVAFNLGGNQVHEKVASPDMAEFPVEPVFETNATPLPEPFTQRFIEAMDCVSTDASRYVITGVCLDVSETSSHYLIGTDGRHLFSANSFTLPLAESVIVPKHKLLTWRGLSNLPWALAARKTDSSTFIRIAAGDWSLTMKTINGNYPNWRRVIPADRECRTNVVSAPLHTRRAADGCHATQTRRTATGSDANRKTNGSSRATTRKENHDRNQRPTHQRGIPPHTGSGQNSPHKRHRKD